MHFRNRGANNVMAPLFPLSSFNDLAKVYFTIVSQVIKNQEDYNDWEDILNLQHDYNLAATLEVQIVELYLAGKIFNAYLLTIYKVTICL